MNANELADDLNGGDVSYITMDKAATMLRQQQAEIEALKAKTLTDEEILRIADQIVINDRTLGNFSIDFARAILRKAQEK